jgi:N-acetylmuramoyl-L-alanine amidase
MVKEGIDKVDSKLRTVASVGKYTTEELNILASIIWHESRGQSKAGKLAVGTVIMNRAKQNSKLIASVVYQKNQFSGISRGYIKRVKPDKESIECAKRVLNGYRSFGKEIRWYCNEKTATSKWMQNNLKRVIKIGDHSFYMEVLK